MIIGQWQGLAVGHADHKWNPQRLLWKILGWKVLWRLENLNLGSRTAAVTDLWDSTTQSESGQGSLVSAVGCLQLCSGRNGCPAPGVSKERRPSPVAFIWRGRWREHFYYSVQKLLWCKCLLGTHNKFIALHHPLWHLLPASRADVFRTLEERGEQAVLISFPFNIFFFFLWVI